MAAGPFIATQKQKPGIRRHPGFNFCRKTIPLAGMKHAGS